MAIVYRYIGGGFLPGIPARDLTDEDVAALSDAARADLAAHVAAGDGIEDKDEAGRARAARVFEAVKGAKPAAATDQED